MTSSQSLADENILFEFQQALELLAEYARSSRNMDEQTYRKKYENKCSPMLFVQHQPLDGGFDVYRSRMAESVKPDEDITNPSTFSYIPTEKCSDLVPSIQRCNFTGQSIFYASLFVKANFLEIDKDCCAGKAVYMSKWHINDGVNVNMFRIIPPEGVDMNEEYKGYLKTDTENNPPYITAYLRKLGEIFMNNEDGENKISKYLPCALIANFIYKYRYIGKPVFSGLSSVYDGILYPSVKDKDRCMLNAAFTQDFIDKYAELQTVVKGVVNEDLESVSMQEIGFCHDMKISWYRPIVLRDSIKPTNCLYVDEQNKIHDMCEGKIFDGNHNEIKNNFVAFFVGLDQWMKEIVLKKTENIDIKKVINESFRKSIKGDFVQRNLTGWTLEKEDGTINIIKVVYYFECQITLEKVL